MCRRVTQGAQAGGNRLCRDAVHTAGALGLLRLLTVHALGTPKAVQGVCRIEEWCRVRAWHGLGMVIRVLPSQLLQLENNKKPAQGIRDPHVVSPEVFRLLPSRQAR